MKLLEIIREFWELLLGVLTGAGGLTGWYFSNKKNTSQLEQLKQEIERSKHVNKVNDEDFKQQIIKNTQHHFDELQKRYNEVYEELIKVKTELIDYVKKFHDVSLQLQESKYLIQLNNEKMASLKNERDTLMFEINKLREHQEELEFKLTRLKGYGKL